MADKPTYAWVAEYQRRFNSGSPITLVGIGGTAKRAQKILAERFPEESIAGGGEWSKWTTTEYRAVTNNYLFTVTRWEIK